MTAQCSILLFRACFFEIVDSDHINTAPIFCSKASLDNFLLGAHLNQQYIEELAYSISKSSRYSIAIKALLHRCPHTTNPRTRPRHPVRNSNPWQSNISMISIPTRQSPRTLTDPSPTFAPLLPLYWQWCLWKSHEDPRKNSSLFADLLETGGFKTKIFGKNTATHALLWRNTRKFTVSTVECKNLNWRVESANVRHKRNWYLSSLLLLCPRVRYQRKRETFG